MARENKNWWESRVLRSVDNLKLWHENPRLDPSNKLSHLRDFVDELISDPSDEQNFITLMKSIVTQGFRSFDPVVVWKNENDDFIVAEGNRRVMALKLLRSPSQSPVSIRKTVVSLSRKIDRDEIEKIRVCLAPSYDDARWYILQRHSSASNQIRWQRLQQQRYIISVYDSVGQDIEETIEQTGFKKAAIIDALRFVKIRDIATGPEITKFLTDEEKEQVLSHRINMTVLERWFSNSTIRNLWHIDFNEDGVTINANMNSFYVAYAKFLKLMLTKNNDLGFIVNTRTIDSHFDDILKYLPTVKNSSELDDAPNLVDISLPQPASPPKTQTQKPDDISVVKSPLKGDPKRRKLTDIYHEISTTSYKLRALFKELQKLPVHSYPNVSAASIRIFLELSVDEFIKSNNLIEIISKLEKKAYREIILSQKLIRLKGEFINQRDAMKVIEQLLHSSNDHSLNTLNEYIHGSKVHKVDPQFLNRFWDMLTPLFSELISLREV
ncbi:ParB/Srx family N-terminal domain-containing protein [Yokenella regensburgei]|uniref:ParB/Srx family N-terminal domain-containing protein n=1 Tax=Yokenella regensburgei TaxID=158877 RepID=UPI002076EA7A|nr:ParB/Srx family N-terminal domain-containing protein [Yokenella regensburgei]